MGIGYTMICEHCGYKAKIWEGYGFVLSSHAYVTGVCSKCVEVVTIRDKDMGPFARRLAAKADAEHPVVDFGRLSYKPSDSRCPHCGGEVEMFDHLTCPKCGEKKMSDGRKGDRRYVNELIYWD